MNTQKLMQVVRTQFSLSKKQLNLRVADELKAAELTGFPRQGVSPIGMLVSMPIYLAERVATLQVGFNV
jgi:prolyl-tRNA editing enzyme YbaK/EbsC (Cys-tRNA(Pro) deacylase)